MIAFLLVIFVGSHFGYITVDGIASEQECHALASRIAQAPQGYAWFAKPTNHDCIAYRIAR